MEAFGMQSDHPKPNKSGDMFYFPCLDQYNIEDETTAISSGDSVIFVPSNSLLGSTSE